MKKFNKIIIFLLSIILLTVSLFGCNGDNPGGGDDGDNPPVVSSIAETNEYLVKDGRSDYVVVTSNSPVNWEAQAASEMVANIKKATGVTLPIKTESEVGNNQKMLVIGNTELTATAGVSAPIATYGARGFVVKEISSNVYIVGGDTQGTLYGVYEFLHHEFGYEPYAIDEIYIDTGVLEKKVLAFNLSEIPDIAYIQGVREYYRPAYAAEGHRMRFNNYGEIFISSDQPWHNVMKYLPRETFEAEHPKWYANNEELHYTAHGDLDELKAMQEAVYQEMVKRIDESFAEGKYYEYIGFMQNDHSDKFPTSDNPRKDDKGNNLWENEEGHVDSVKALQAHYGKSYQAAMVMHFVNPIQVRISEYVANKYNGRKMSIMFFAYEQTENAPVVDTNEDGVFEPMSIISATEQDVLDGNANPIFADEIYKDLYDGKNDGLLKVHPDTTVFTAPIRNEFHNDYEGESARATTEKWAVLTEKQAFWFYDFYFNSTTFMYYDSVYSMQSYFQAAKSVNSKYVFFECGIENKGYYAFGRLLVYLKSKLGWRVDSDVHQLIDDFFNNYYKEAAGTMKKFFNSVTAYYAYLKQYKSFTGTVGAGAGNLNVDNYKEGVLQGWLEIIDQAYLDIEILKYTDKERYDILYDRILYDSLWPRYLLMYFYANEAFTDTSFIAELNQFKVDCAALGVKGAGDVDIETLSLTRD